MTSILSSPIEYLKGVGPQRADLLKKELQVFTFKDLLDCFPFRHVDKTQVRPIRELSPQSDYAQVSGTVISIEEQGEKRGKRLVAVVTDGTGMLELTWFQGIPWALKRIQRGGRYLVFGKVGFFMGRPQIVHPELEEFSEEKVNGKPFLEPVYPSTEKLKARGLNGRQIGKLVWQLFEALGPRDLPENLPAELVERFRFLSRYETYRQVHFPARPELQTKAVDRLKFEEFFFAQLRLNILKIQRHKESHGPLFAKVGDLFNTFYKDCLPFELTNAQKRVLREIRQDTGLGKQMNRLLQGDVGSGKTIVAVLALLLAVDNGFQGCLMAPTEILAQQHFEGISRLLEPLDVRVALLTGSTRSKERKEVLRNLQEGSVHIVIGTHALIEDPVQFRALGLAIVDEQHRFGVAQRASLWKKSVVPPHILVMTATPIPRTLAMTAYGDLDYSIMDELPPGRQPIVTVHRHESGRPKVMDFIKSEIAKGRQAYIIFPLIEESEKLAYEDLMKGYDNVKAYFPEPTYWISMVHGRQASDVKETNMQRFVQGDTQIMVSTTVIEVGVNVPNASVMVIESSEKFGLSQLHQLRGRVGRGSEQSYCILMTGSKLGQEARERIKVMTSTQNGFEIAEKDLELRGPGDIEGTRQSGELNFRLASIVQDKQWLELAKREAVRIAEADPELLSDDHRPIREFLLSQKGKTAWSKIS
ncbi:ATP-dependent DNA helicase RecG [Dinghuibacter silviterrae]|uniref:ATP-dependent DNA helicase RecG n=1 Tax=Dinghuibacter silviterrae TaxID=1539049 RepID=A0A4R8DMJ9_9BACT|nr:ATP-dependent DNA helicase RecG [Dinghuibacter silviterrae]TDW99193.1 ATP-dependent DNA helicase RecG [Dinghuibacter silviterrae]